MTVGEGYRGEDYPVRVNSTFWKRVQSIDFTENVPIITHYELGNSVPIGGAEDVRTYSGRVTWLPIDNQGEAILLSLADITNAAPKGIKDFVTAAPVAISTPVDTLGGVRTTSLDYSLRVGGDFVANAGLIGTTMSAGSAITATAPSGRGAYRAPDIDVTMGGTAVLRAQGFTIRGALRADQLLEIGTSTPIETKVSQPGTTATIDWVESPNMAPLKANLEPTLDAPIPIAITIGSGGSAKRLTVVNAVYSGKGARGFINGYATRSYNYTSVGDNDYGGLKIDKTT